MGQNSNSNSNSADSLPKNLKSTLQDLESTLTEWEKITPDPLTSLSTQLQESSKESHEKELQKKAKDLLYRLKEQINELS